MLLHPPRGVAPAIRLRLLALAVPVAGLALWFLQANGHGLVSAEGFAFGALVALFPWAGRSGQRRYQRGGGVAFRRFRRTTAVTAATAAAPARPATPARPLRRPVRAPVTSVDSPAGTSVTSTTSG
ncbi:hypothetical protein [Cryptosporangium sp. NPDC051539]|uniref:hypothetical protein n=1 Tax=Cryptosporangium sp. NPDC051539 TaxID=3363962 RepID=UPI00379BCBEF